MKMKVTDIIDKPYSNIFKFVSKQEYQELKSSLESEINDD